MCESAACSFSVGLEPFQVYLGCLDPGLKVTLYFLQSNESMSLVIDTDTKSTDTEGQVRTNNKNVI